jgi:hypothetical protein
VGRPLAPESPIYDRADVGRWGVSRRRIDAAESVT